MILGARKIGFHHSNNSDSKDTTQHSNINLLDKIKSEDVLNLIFGSGPLYYFMEFMKLLSYISGFKMLMEIMKTIIEKLIQPNIVIKVDRNISPKPRAVNWKKIADQRIEDRVNVSDVNE